MVPDFETLDSKIASALKMLLTADIKRRVYMEKDSRSLRGRQLAYMIHVNFKISGTGEALRDLYDLPRVHLKSDNTTAHARQPNTFMLPASCFAFATVLVSA